MDFRFRGLWSLFTSGVAVARRCICRDGLGREDGGAACDVTPHACLLGKVWCAVEYCECSLNSELVN